MNPDRATTVRRVALHAPTDATPLAAWLFGALFLGAITVLSLPVARGPSIVLGAMPLWLLGMPLASLGALAAVHACRMRLPRRRMPEASPTVRRLRPGTAQARRREGSTGRRGLRHAA